MATSVNMLELSSHYSSHLSAAALLPCCGHYGDAYSGLMSQHHLSGPPINSILCLSWCFLASPHLLVSFDEVM